MCDEGASQQSPDGALPHGQKTPTGHTAVLQLLQTIGEAYSLLSKYHCQVRPLLLDSLVTFVASLVTG